MTKVGRMYYTHTKEVGCEVCGEEALSLTPPSYDVQIVELCLKDRAFIQRGTWVAVCGVM